MLHQVKAAITWGEQQNTEATNSNVCSPDDQSTNVCNPEEQAPAGEIPPIEATNSNVCSPDDQSTNVCNPEEQAPAGEIPPIEATNSNVCSPDDQSTNVCNPEEQAPAGEIPPISGGSRCLVDLWISAFLPPQMKKEDYMFLPLLPLSAATIIKLGPDDRNTPVKGGSARLWSYLVVDLCTQSGNQVITKIHGIGVSHGWMHSYSGLEGDEDPVIDESPAGPVVEEIARASAEDMYEDVNSKHDYGDGSVFVTVVGDASIPLIPHAPAINYEFQIKLIPQFSSFNSQEKGPSTMSSVPV